MARHETHPASNNEVIEGVIVSDLPPRLRDVPSAEPSTPAQPNIPPIKLPTIPPIPRVELPHPPRYPQPHRQGMPPRHINTGTVPGFGSVVRRPAAPLTAAAPPQPPAFSEAAPTTGKDRGKSIVYGGMAVLLVLGAGATYALWDRDNSVVTLKAEATRTPGSSAPTSTSPEQPAETLPEPADLSFLSAKNINAEPSSSTTSAPKKPTRPVVPNVFPTTPESITPPTPTKIAAKPSTSTTTESSPSSPTTTPEQTPTGEVKLPTTPSTDSLELINASINKDTVRQLDDRYENFASNLDLEALARNGELPGLDVQAIERNQKLINAVYAMPGARQQLGQPNTLNTDMLRNIVQSNTSPAANLNAHTDTLLRNANSLFAQTGSSIVEAAVVNDLLESRLINSLENGETLNVPLAENGTVLKVRTARLSKDVTVAFAASYAEYQYPDKRVAELRWTLLQPLTPGGDFAATTVFSEILKEQDRPSTPTTESTPTDTYTEPTPEPTTTTEAQQSDKKNDRKSREERRKNRNRG